MEAGLCNDWPMEAFGGACVFEPETYFRESCRSRYQEVCNNSAGGCLADNIGCIIYPVSTSQEVCESTVLVVIGGGNPGSFRGVWYDKARTRTQCENYGCGYAQF